MVFFFKNLSQSKRSHFQSWQLFFSETANIWTHLISSVLISLLTVYHFKYAVTITEWETLFPWALFLLSSICAFSFSTIFHTFCCMSEKVYAMVAMLDYLGISSVLMGSNIPVIAFNFHCIDHHKWFYQGLLILGFCVLVVLSVIPAFATLRWKRFRVSKRN